MRWIKDEEFLRGNCPMTKEEIRILSISKLELKNNYKVLDIGAGTGSISIQVSKICYKGNVFAIEKDEEALSILQKNKNKFNVYNLEIIKGNALEVTINDDFDAIFIGGSNGNIEKIIDRYDIKLKLGGKMVLNFITISNLYKTLEKLKSKGYDTECIQVAISKTKGKCYMLMANNPIFIVSAVKI